MTRAKLGLLGLCVAVLGLLTVCASAQATVWLILDGKGGIKEGSTLHASLGAEAEGVHTLHAEILKIKVLFLCKELKLVNANLLANGNVGEKEGAVKNSKILYSGCTTDLNGVAAPECIPKDPADGEGRIVTKASHAAAIGEDLVQLAPDEGGTFVTIVLPAACPIGTSVPVIGNVVFKDCENLALTHLVKHLSEAGTGAKLWVISQTEEHKATILGSTWIFLTGEDAGLQFSMG